jgi:hypothetical protein
MRTRELTDHEGRATTRSMQGMAGRNGLKISAVVGMASLALSGCVTVEAPTEPIVIELNVNIRQEVIYRLAEDAGNTIEENADIF